MDDTIVLITIYFNVIKFTQKCGWIINRFERMREKLADYQSGRKVCNNYFELYSEYSVI